METSYFSAEFFAGNRRRLRELFTGTAPIVITAAGRVQRAGDNPFAFRQDSSFWYLTGLEQPDAVLVMDRAGEYLIVPDRSPVDEVFGLAYDYDAITKRSGLATILEAKPGWKRLNTRLKKVQHVATLGAAPSYIEHDGMFANPARARLIDAIKAANPEVELLDVREHLARMRMIKQAPELAALRQAIDITVKGVKQVSRRLDRYSHEYQIEADLTHVFRYQGARGHAFPPIVAAGKNTCHLHQEHNDSPLGDAHHIYMDVGAEVENYAADITRTYFLKPPTKRERAIVDAVLDVAAFARQRLKPGISIRDNEKAVEQYMGEKLRELGLIKTITKENVRKYYTHACSHYLGLDTHDVGDYGQPLAPGMVLTVEPGIYIPAEGFGVRIEDDVLVTHSGIEILSRKLPY